MKAFAQSGVDRDFPPLVALASDDQAPFSGGHADVGHLQVRDLGRAHPRVVGEFGHQGRGAAWRPVWTGQWAGVAQGEVPMASRAPLQADLANAQGQAIRQAAHIRQSETKLSELLGERAWRKSGLGASADVDQLQHRITELEQLVVDLLSQLQEHDQELEAARTANRELITTLNRST
ncbi:hypothetical protein [Umezawaea sp. Da 62-37]|uniref:hypothetical protein n=1 Tax=Umezawaea sp. Da 62-37 TaxID=3075927 RepID=UPI0037DC31D8